MSLYCISWLILLAQHPNYIFLLFHRTPDAVICLFLSIVFCIRHHCQIESPFQQHSTTVRILLPDDYDIGKTYRVLYVLPVVANDERKHGDGLLEIMKYNFHNTHQLICVAPEFTSKPWYADHSDNMGRQDESHFLKTILPYIDDNYPTLKSKEGRLLIGFSKSGWGAFSLLLRHPGCFGRAVAWDAPLMLRVPRSYSMETFGTVENFRTYELTSLLRAKGPELGDSVRLNHFGYSSFQADHEAAHELMDTLKIPHGYREAVPREHTWTSGWLPEAVAMLCEAG